MIMNKLYRCLATQSRSYTVIVERYTKPPIMKAHEDQRKRNLKSDHYQLKFVDCLHNKKWGNIDLILTEYVEGIGHKGEIVNVPRHTAYYELLPSRQAVYVTDEYLKFYEKDRQALAGKAKVSPFAKRTKDELEKSVIEIPLNMSVEWKLNEDLLRIALRYNKFMCSNESIKMPEGLNINNKNWKEQKEPFVAQIKINDYLTANVKFRVVELNLNKLWEEFAAFQKTV